GNEHRKRRARPGPGPRIDEVGKRHAVAERRLAGAAPYDDPPIPGGSQIVDEGPCVIERLARRPNDGFEVGYRFAQANVAREIREMARKLRQRSSPCAGSLDEMPGLHFSRTHREI